MKRRITNGYYIYTKMKFQVNFKYKKKLNKQQQQQQ